MHLLVLDGSLVLPSLVRRLAPEGVEVESVATFDEALKRLALRPPDALIVNLTPADLPWKSLQSLCEKHSPPIPVLYESCIYRSPVEAGLASLNGTGHFLEKPYSLTELRSEIERLVDLATPRADLGHDRPSPSRRAR
jgi:DNA-binding NtrC family response regulator